MKIKLFEEGEMVAITSYLVQIAEIIAKNMISATGRELAHMMPSSLDEDREPLFHLVWGHAITYADHTEQLYPDFNKRMWMEYIVAKINTFLFENGEIDVFCE